MDDTITQILEACSLARELESSLPSTAIHPHFLLKSCENIAEAFIRVIHSLHNVDQYSFSTTAALAPMLFENYATADLLPPRTSDLEIHMTAMEQSGAAASCYISAHGTDTEAAVAGSSGAERRPARAGSSDQRSNRRRKAGGDRVTRMVPALRTGNTENPPDDGYTWRKYGQKTILGCRFPRSYYRCTHRSYYGCLAKKQVQRLDDDPYTFEVTYCGNHSCLTSTKPLLLPSLVQEATAAAATIATTTTAINNNNNNNNNNSNNNTNFSLAEAMIPGQSSALSTSIQLGSWITRESEVNHTLNEQGGRDGDWPVADLADVMFNSGSSGSSMDAIFYSRQE